ncbi:MAG: hypothetical protein CK604_06075 [Curvibacter sp. PD_MW3]|nr:MAG: hypothetical protein CK604_06075 [Curvibacter sp. PD_MW3]
MRSATVKDFEAVIRDAEVEDLRIFLGRFMEMCVQPGANSAHFGNATNVFIDACKNIYNDPSVPRLVKLIESLFKNAKLESRLSPPVPAQPQRCRMMGCGMRMERPQPLSAARPSQPSRSWASSRVRPGPSRTD